MNIRALTQIAVLVGTATFHTAYAAGYAFTPIAGLDNVPPSFDGQTVALSRAPNSWSNEITLVDAATGTANSVARSYTRRSYVGTIIPGSTATFTRLGPPSVSNGAVAFAGMGGTSYETAQFGIYSNIGGTLALIANLTTTVPGTSGTFNYFDENSVVLAGGTVVFSAADAQGKWGVYRWQNNQLGLLVNAHTPPPAVQDGLPPHAPFDYFSDIDYKNGQLAFQSGSGIFVQQADGSLTTVADMDMRLPHDHPWGASSYALFDVNLAGNDVIFKWWSDAGIGLYRWNDATGITAVVDRVTAMPGLGEVATDAAGDLAFKMGDAIYIDDADSPGPYERVVGAGDTLDGKTLREVAIGPQGLGAGALAFSVMFSDGSKALYLATPVPEPETWAMFLAGLGLLGGIARRRKQNICPS